MANDSPVGPPQSWQTSVIRVEVELAHERRQIGCVPIETMGLFAGRLF